MNRSWFESTARARTDGLLDPGSFQEFLPPRERFTSPHLLALDAPVAFDDGVIVGKGLLMGRSVLVAAQEGAFMGGAVGEVHGAKIVGLLERALDERPQAVLLLIESGGVRLHEANAGLIAVSEIMRALMDVRSAGISVLALLGGRYGCFGGMSIVASLCSAIVMSEQGRLGLSGPEVIETTHGVEEFDSSDRALVWRTLGGKHRFIIRETAALVEDDIEAFRLYASRYIDTHRSPRSTNLVLEHQRLARRLERWGHCKDALEIWSDLGIQQVEHLPLLDTSEFLSAVQDHRA